VNHRQPYHASKLNAKQRALKSLEGVAAHLDQEYGAGTAASMAQDVAATQEARAATLAKQAEAQQISANRVAQGEGAELADDNAAELETITAPARPRPPRKTSKVQQAIRAVRSLGEKFRKRHARDNQAAAEQAEALAAETLKTHGIRHHYRLLPQVAFFGAYMAGLDRNGIAALQTLQECNMPAARRARVLEAAFAPQGYSPRRDIRRGKRAHQTLYEYDGRTFGGARWKDGARMDDHPGAIRVIQCAVFAWVARTRTRRSGYSYVLRGFGRGLFGSICQCGKDALTGHADGMPGALLALKLSGFFEYNAPPPEVVNVLDRGPSGHAYNIYWFPSEVAELELERFHERMANLARLELFGELLEEPSLIEERAQAPPVVIDPAQIPF
jgi:hypothetical protein